MNSIGRGGLVWDRVASLVRAKGAPSYHMLEFSDGSPLRVALFRQNLFLVEAGVGLAQATTGRACGILRDRAYHIVSTDIEAGSG